MSIQKQVFDALIALADGVGSYAAISIGTLPKDSGISAGISTGGAQSVTLAHGGQYTLDIVLNAKHTNQAAALDALCCIHEQLTRLHDLPSGQGWQMTAIRTNGAPSTAGRDGNQWLCVSGLTIEYGTI